ncbi:MAG: 50S ribosomal protein L21 [Candidatus Cloacimonetes bacterium]|nr:50S ribosomal protein L21 [Candidatus Cloacimonadota bacterium]
MYAIVNFKGNQYKAEKDKILRVPYLSDKEIGSELEINEIFMLRNDEDIQVGTPLVDNVKVIAEVVAHKRDKKIIVFKKKRRKGYAKKNGHRQDFTEIMIKDIVK